MVLHGLLSRDLSPLVILGMAVINKNVYKVRKSSHSNLLQRSLRIPPVLCVHQEFSNKPAWFKLSVLGVQATSVSPHFPHFRTFLLKPANFIICFCNASGQKKSCVFWMSIVCLLRLRLDRLFVVWFLLWPLQSLVPHRPAIPLNPTPQ